MDVFNFYMVSHDNLIKNIYEKQLIILPIRLGTLDFHEMTKDGELTEKAVDAIYQGKYVTKQQVQNGLKKDEDRKFYIKFEKRKK